VEKKRVRHLLIATIAILMVAAGPIAIQSRADDAHHPEKSAKKSTKEKGKATGKDTDTVNNKKRSPRRRPAKRNKTPRALRTFSRFGLPALGKPIS
jgi:hypothetical protein